MQASHILTAATLQSPAIRHGFFTRQGGVSTGRYASLNAGPGSKDDPAAVAHNRRLVADAMGVPANALHGCYQIHSTISRVAEQSRGSLRPEGDAIVSATKGLACSVLTADCAPVLLADVEAGVVGAAHAGWKGALGGVIESVISAMESLGARPQRICAAIGPCIGPHSYEVGPEFLERFMAHAPGSRRFFRQAESPGKHLFDLPGFVLGRLQDAGVGKAEWIGRDTCTEEDLFFSNRRAFKRGEDDYGRLIACIVLN